METYPFEKYAVLLNNFRGIPGLSRTVSTTILQEKFSNLKSGFISTRSAAIIKARTEAPDFNIFYLLRASRDEVFTHSVFLAELLNPTGSHGQGTLFLKSFLKQCKSLPQNSDHNKDGFQVALDQIDDPHWTTISEYVTHYGRMDIVLINPSLGFLCVIENKVDALEQDNQLNRYLAWMETMREDYPIRSLVFLTVTGKLAASADIANYLPLSYRKDISSWLYQTLPLIQAPAVHALVQQYCEVTNRL